jgi:hypothetical protein
MVSFSIEMVTDHFLPWQVLLDLILFPGALVITSIVRSLQAHLYDTSPVNVHSAPDKMSKPKAFLKHNKSKTKVKEQASLHLQPVTT